MKAEVVRTAQNHIEEYRQQIEKHRLTIVALEGAIQALERLQKEPKDEEEVTDE